MGKVTVKHFLNKKIKPIKKYMPFSERHATCYPIYLRVIANRKSIEIKSRIMVIDPSCRNSIADFENDALYVETLLDQSTSQKKTRNLESRNYKRINGLLEKEKAAISDLYYYYSEKLGESFDLSVLNDVADDYLVSVRNLLNSFCVEALRNVFLNDSTYRSFGKVISLDSDFIELTNSLDVLSKKFNDDYAGEFYDKYLIHSETLYDAVMVFDRLLEIKDLQYDTPVITWLRSGYGIEDVIEAKKDYEKEDPVFPPNIELLVQYFDSFFKRLEDLPQGQSKLKAS